MMVSTAVSVKIVNGDDADIEDHPWMVSFQIRTDGVKYTHQCGGAIIDKSWVLTAAHCNLYYSYKVKDMQIAAGSAFLSQMTDIIPLKQTYYPDNYDRSLEHDIMLLQLKTPLKFGSTINKIDLDTDIGKNYTGNLCTITGWGPTNITARKKPDRLQRVTLPAISNAKCGAKYSFFAETYWKNNIICLQEEGKDSCQGDSGGPVICNNDKKLAGTQSFGLGCNQTTPSVHTRISRYLDWIKDTVNTKNKKNKKDKKTKKNTKAKGKKSNSNKKKKKIDTSIK
ncbi:CTRB [Mytilus edulis]|uniref:CTRB n=1 Tax=Mytilus edulis TaxID=6550 RepID=A0A8S3Q7U3_MYTED|nr:CTRB [Mytilus edulis]